MVFDKNNFIRTISPGDRSVFIQRLGTVIYDLNPWRVVSSSQKKEFITIRLNSTDNPINLRFPTTQDAIEALTIFQIAISRVKDQSNDLSETLINYIDTTIIEYLNNYSFSFRQNQSSNIWEVEHDLSRRPSVTVTNDDFEKIIGSIKLESNGLILVRFNQPLTGWVFLN